MRAYVASLKAEAYVIVFEPAVPETDAEYAMDAAEADKSAPIVASMMA